MKSREMRLQSFLAAVTMLAFLAAGSGNFSAVAQAKKPAPKKTTTAPKTSAPKTAAA